MSTDSCVSQLLPITHKIFKSFNCNSPVDISRVFLDILNAFDKVQYDGLIFKLVWNLNIKPSCQTVYGMARSQLAKVTQKLS